MTPDEAIDIVKTKSSGRTRWKWQEPFLDEVLVKEIELLRTMLRGAEIAATTPGPGVLTRVHNEPGSQPLYYVRVNGRILCAGPTIQEAWRLLGEAASA